MSAAITCTSCNRPLRVPENVLGQTVQCPLCLDEFVAQADPAAESAARAAEPPRRAARPQPEPSRAEALAAEVLLAPAVEAPPAAAVPVLELADDPPAAAPAGPKKALVFPVIVTRDPDRILRGPMDGELTAEGLYLRKTRQPPAFAAAGARARYLGTNRLSVTVEGREVELAVAKPWASNYHLAKDAAAYLNSKGPFPNGPSYRLPWYLYAIPPLFLALPFVAGPFGLITDGFLGVFLWILIALALGAAAFIVAAQARLRPRARVVTALSLLGVGVVLPLVAIPLTPSYTVDPALWSTFKPADGEFSVLMPGAPGATGWAVPPDAATKRYSVDVAQPEIHFAVYVSPAPAVGNFGNFGGLPIQQQAATDAQNLLTREFSNVGYVYWSVNRPAGPYGKAYGELFGQVPSNGYGNRSYAAGKAAAARVYVVNGKVFILTAVGPRVRLDAPDVVKFFNSVSFPPATVRPANPPAVSPANMDGVAAYWSFNREHMPAANQLLANQAMPDETLNNPDGMAHNATAVGDGARGGAIHFNGRGSHFDFSDATLNFAAGDEFTFCGWVRTRAVQGVVLSNRNGDDGGAAVIDLILDNGGLVAQVRQDGNPFNAALQIGGGKPVNDGAWHHFALSRLDGAVFLFIDGVLQRRLANPIAQGAITTNLHALGAELYWQQHNIMNAGNPALVGDVDEFCVFGRALTPAEVRQLAGAAGP